MKTMIYFVTIIYFATFVLNLKAQDTCNLSNYIYINNIPGSGWGDGEIAIYNQTLYQQSKGGAERPDSIRIVVFPVGAIFNGINPFTQVGNNYSPTASNPVNSTNHTIAGKDTVVKVQSTTTSGSKILINFDFNTGEASAFSVGYGKYKIEFYRTLLKFNDTTGYYWDWEFANYVYIDLRNLTTFPNIPNIQGSGIDFRIDYFNKDTITFQHDLHYNVDSSHYKKFWHINLVNKNIIKWEYYGTCIPPLTPNKGFFTTDSSDNGAYLKWPINVNQYNGNIGLENPGEIGMNLKITDTVSTRDTLIDAVTNITVIKDAALFIGRNMVFNMSTPVCPSGGYNNLIIEDSATGLVLYANAKLNVYSPNQLTFKSNSYIRLVQNSEINIFPGATLCNEGATVIGAGKINFKNGVHLFCSTVNDMLLKDSAKIVLSDSAVLEIPDNTILHFTGIKSGLIMKPNSKIKLGVGCKIIFDSSATLIANGATFTSLDSTQKWDGIILNNSDADTITNCTFSNAVTALTFTNNSNSAYKNRIITNNTFNIPSWGVNKGIYGENNYKILIKNNVFNMPVYFPSSSPVSLIYIGVYLKNNSTLEAAGGDIEEDQSSNYSLNIIENTFSNGCASVILANYTSNYLPYLISDNTFNNTASANIIGMKISGAIRDNNFTSEDVPLGIHLINSNANLYKNTINSRDVGLHLAGHCYPNLAPYVSGENLVWTGGNNYITTTDIDNIQLSSSGYVNTDFGNNNFTINNSSSYHIYGWLDSTYNIYYARDNCWNGSAQSRIYLKTYGSADTIPVPVVNTNNYNCTDEITPSGWNVSYNGNGKYDSIKISDDNTGEQPSEADILCAQAVTDGRNGLYAEAIIDYKYLFDTYPGYEDVSGKIYDMYACYQSLDTSEGESYRKPLYRNIVEYLNEKILSDDYENNAEFCDNAYDIILMSQCIIDLNYASAGYEFLAFNHSDPDIRLAASWNYAEIEDLINSGEGGGEKQLQITNGKFQIKDQEQLKEHNELIKLNELVNDDPVMSRMKRTYEKTSIERKERIDKQISRENKTVEVLNEKIIRSRQVDLQKEDRAKRNIFDLRNMSKEEKEMSRMEDMALTTLDFRNESGSAGRISIPLQYRLEQNYPNPFNPVTNLEFAISKTGFVSLKIYDVLGQEIRTLVSEIKQPGIYKIEFDGSSLSSGIYFYTINTQGFTDTKRMILLK